MGQANTTLAVRQPDASLDTDGARGTVSAEPGAYERRACSVYSTCPFIRIALTISWPQAMLTWMMWETALDVDASVCFDDFAGSIDFLSDVDVRAQLNSSFML